MFRFACVLAGLLSWWGCSRDGPSIGAARASLWTAEAPLDGDPPGTLQGRLAIDGTTLVVGAPLDDDAGTDAGAVYVFVRDGSGWVFEQKLLSPSPADSERFGDRVAIDEDVIVVGVPERSLTLWPSPSQEGIAHVFERTGGSWVHLSTLDPPGAQVREYRGHAVAIEGDTIMVGAPGFSDTTFYQRGAVYVFARADATFALAARLDGPAMTALMGSVIALDGDTMALESWMGVRVYVRDASGAWSEQAVLLGSDLVGPEDFGSSLALTGDRVVAGAPLATRGGLADTGAVYVFDRVGSSWTETAIVTPSDASARMRFGTSVVADGGRFAVGAPLAGDSGAVYFFDASLTELRLTHSFAPAGAAIGARLAWRGEWLASSGDGRIYPFSDIPSAADGGVADAATPDGDGGELLDAELPTDAGATDAGAADAGASRDAGGSTSRDAGMAASSDGGCGCRVARAAHPRSLLAIGLLLFLLAALRLGHRNRGEPASGRSAGELRLGRAGPESVRDVSTCAARGRRRRRGWWRPSRSPLRERRSAAPRAAP